MGTEKLGVNYNALHCAVLHSAFIWTLLTPSIHVLQAEFRRTNTGKQALYGIIQGGVYEDLRQESAAFM